jgi:hypothetical protein
VTLRYRVDSEIPPVVPLRLKVEINTREHFTVYGAEMRAFRVHSPWFEGASHVPMVSRTPRTMRCLLALSDLPSRFIDISF